MDNRIAEVLAQDLGAELQYVWWAQHRGHIRKTLAAGACDLLISVPASLDTVLVTAPYYRSSYVFVYRRDAGIRIGSFDSPLLRRLRVGVQLIGDDYSNSPPAHALARRRIIHNIRGYRVTDDYSRPNPPARIIEAVAAREIDVAVAWGPLTGYFAQRQKVPLQIEFVSPQTGGQSRVFVWDMSMAVRRGDVRLHAAIEAAIKRNRGAIDRILKEYGVPRLDIGVDAVNCPRAGSSDFRRA